MFPHVKGSKDEVQTVLFQDFLDPIENPILQEPYGLPSLDVIRFRNVTNGISFGFKAIESSGSSVNSYSGVRNKVAP